MSSEYSSIQKQDEAEDQKYFEERLADIENFLKLNKASLDGYLDTCEKEELLPDYTAYGAVQEIRNQMEGLCKQFKAMLTKESANISQYARKISTLNQLYRTMIQLKVPASRMLSWCSTAYNQSLETSFFHPETVGGAGERFNYDRTASYATSCFEGQICEVFGFDKDQVGVLATSSGMAAYALLENYFIQDVLLPGDQIYIPRQLYGETELIMFRNTSFFNIVRHDLKNETDIIENILHLKPKIIFLESMQNGLGTDILDIMLILKALSEAEQSNPLHIIIDDTLLTGAINPFIFSSDKLHIYYLVSAIKYLQLGMDSGYAGVLAVKYTQYDHFRRLRGFLGQGLYDQVAWLYPGLTREQFLHRMSRFTRNAQLVTEEINNCPDLQNRIQAYHPYNKAGLLFTGCLVTLQFHNGPLSNNIRNQKQFHNMIAYLMDYFKQKGLSFNHTESFGFSTPRINVSGWCKNKPPYLRIGCGDRSYEETKLFAETLVQALQDNTSSNKG